ncbi:MAG TPA: hypothetical protein VKB34_09445 [Povalibacter sp.]|nr:hypothetical protein [Povalibacter sp.]
MASERAYHDPSAFPFWTGGVVQPAFRRFHLSDDALTLLGRRELVLTAVAWLPLFILSALDGRAWNGVQVPFLFDYDVQGRLLIALPLLLAGEVAVNQRMPEVVEEFVARRIIVGSARAGFDAAVNSALTLSRSVFVEIIVVALAFSSVLGSRHFESLGGAATWRGDSPGGPITLTAAGWWYVLISRPLFRIVLFRWYLKLFLWAQFLWRVSRLDLQLAPAHPDRSGGLGFLSVLNNAFAPFLFAHGTMLAATIANGVIHSGRTLAQYQAEMIVFPVAALLLVLGPELAFVSSLWRAKRQGLLAYGALGERYVREFEQKWLRGEPTAADPLLGSADIQSLADLFNGFQVVEKMRLIPPTRETMLGLAVVTLLPLAPLPLTVVSGSELLERLVKIVL